MRYRRFSFVVGWAAVALLAIAGFAAFSDPGPSANEVQIEAAQASIGHTSGAYAGLGFALVGDAAETAQPQTVTADVDASESGPESEQSQTNESNENESAAGTIASPASGWLTQVEVRALISLYFEKEDVNRAVRVAWCESRFDPEAVDVTTGATGLFKHLPRYWSERADKAGFGGMPPTDPEASVAAAAWAVYEGGGWDVFSCRG